MRWHGTEAALADEGAGAGVIALAPVVDLQSYPSWGLDAVWFHIGGRASTAECLG